MTKLLKEPVELKELPALGREQLIRLISEHIGHEAAKFVAQFSPRELQVMDSASRGIKPEPDPTSIRPK